MHRSFSSGWLRARTAVVVTVSMVLSVSSVGQANAAIETFDDGTEVEITIESPSDGSTPIGGTALLEGTARVGAGDSPPDTSLVVVYDLSGSTLDPAGGDCGGDVNSDGRSNTILDCEIAAMETLEQTAAALGSVSEMGVTLFELGSQAADVQPTPGIQRLTAPGADLNGNDITDIAEVVRTSRWTSSWFSANATVSLFTSLNAGTGNGGTNYSAGLDRACETLAATSEPNRVIVFLSDGGANRGSDVTGVLPCSQPATVYSVAVGANSSCAGDPSGLGSLQEVADLTGGTCTEVVSPEDLPDILSGIISPDLDRIGLSVNGGPEFDISASSSVPLPAPGPDPVQWSYEVTDLAGPVDEVCVTAYASRDLEFVQTTECITLVSNRPPTADAGSDKVVTEGGLIELDGTESSDPDGDPLTYSWTIRSQDGAPVVLSSTTDPVASFIAFDDGIYEFELEVSDGRGTSTDVVQVTVANAPPVLTALAEPASEGGVALITASFTDAGLLDTHTATIEWGDGSPPQDVPISAQGNGWGSLFATHTYGDAGSFVATIVVVDDDGGTAVAESVGVEVRESLALWADSETARRTIDWRGGTGLVEGLVHSNNDIRVRGDDKVIDGRVEFVGGLDAGANLALSEPAVAVDPQEPPVRFDLDDYRPGGRAAIDAGDAYFDMSAACGNRWDPAGPLASGLYYVPCDVKLNSSALAGTVTIAAEGDVQVSGQQADFEPFIDGLLFLSASADNQSMQISSSESTFLGYLYAESGRIDLAGAANTYLCGIIGDRIDITDDDLLIRASDCVRPERTVAPPTLVPELDVEIDVSPDVAVPGTEVATSTTIRNTGSLLIVPGVVGLENLGTDAVTVSGINLGIEYLPAGGDWTAVPAEITTSTFPNDAPGVTFPTGGGFAGTTVGPDGLATWGAEMQVFLPAETVELLLDPAQTLAVRNTFDVQLDNPSSAPVRNLFRFGNDFAEELRALGGDLVDASVVATATDGTAVIVDSTVEPALALLTPGDSATVTLLADVAVPEPRGIGEPADAYLDRLSSLDGTVLTGSAFAISSGGVGTVLGGFETDTTMRSVPVVDLGLTGTEALVAGDDASFAVEIRNSGSAIADALALSAVVDGSGVPVDGEPTSLDPGEIEGATFTYSVPADEPTGVLPVTAGVTWNDANGNPYGDVARDTSVRVATAPDLSALMADEILVDADANGLPSPGDTIRYRTTITNRGATPAGGVVLDVDPDLSAPVIVGSVVTSTGTVTAGNTPGDATIVVDVGVINPMSSAEITWDAVLPTGVDQIEAQGLVRADGLADVTTDDPGVSGTADATVTVIIDVPPSLQSIMVVRLGVDADADDFVSPGDTLDYVVETTNTGLSAATDVSVVVEPDPNTELVVGSVVTTGDVIEGNAPGDTRVVISFSTIVGLDRTTIEFETVVSDPLPGGTTAVTSQGTITSNELPDVLTDDPNQSGTSDPTSIGVVTSTGGSVGGVFPDGSTWGTTGGFGETVPADGDEARAPIGVQTTINPPPGTAIDTWRVVAYPADGSPDAGLVLASGTGTPPAGDIATFDPSVLANGTWIIRIEVVDSEGGVGVEETSVSVQGDLKLGRFTTTYQDASVNVGGIALRVQRTYDTTSRLSSGDFGYGWSLDVADFEVASNRRLGDGPWSAEACGAGFIFVPLCFSPEGRRVVNVTWPDGRVESFDLTPTGNTFFSVIATASYTPRAGATSELRPVPGDESIGYLGGNLTTSFFSGEVYDPDQFILVAQDGTEYLLDTEVGLLLATDLSGNTVSYGPDGIVSSLGPSLTFERDAEGRITTVTQPDGATVSYGYDAAGDLVSVMDQNAAETTFAYDTGHYLTVVDDPGPGALRTLTYGPDGRLTAITDANGLTINVTTDLDDRSTVVTTPDGRQTVITTFDERGNRISVEDIYDGASYVSTFEYSADDKIIRRVDPLGNEYTADYDDDQNLIRYEDPEGNVSTFDYNDRGYPTQSVDPTGAVTAFSYGTSGQLASVTDARGGAQTFTYDTQGNQTSRTDQLGRTWSWTYDTAGLLSSETDPLGNETTFTHDSNGRLVSETAADGGVTAYSYDPAGNLLAIIDPLGHTTSYVYDERNQVLSVTDSAGFVESFTYDSDGRVTSRTDRVGNSWNYAYAFDRLASATSPDGGTITYSYDGAGRLDTLTDALGRVSSFAHDPLGRRVSWTTPVGTDATTTTTRTLDGNGDLVAMTDGEGATTTFTLDGNGRRIAITDPLDRTTTATYDAIGNRTSLSDPSGAITVWTYDDAGQLVTEADPAGAATSFDYDDAGNVRAVTDPLGRTTSFDYDEANRVVSRTLPGGEVSTTTYDLAGRAVATTSAAGYGQTYARDARGLVTATTDELGNTTSSIFDGEERPLSQTDAQGNTTTFGYDPVGRLTSETDPLGGTVAWAYDLAGQQVSITDPNGAMRLQGFDDGGRLVSETDALGRTTVHTYDAVGRRTSTVDPRGVSTTHAYDAAGQLISQAAGSDSRTFDYDATGRPTSMSDSTGLTTFGYDDVGRLTEVLAPAGDIGYSWNAAGERTEMTQPEGTVTYGYDPNGYLESLTDWRGDRFDFAADADGRPERIERSNGIDSAYDYDDAGRLIGLTHSDAGGVVDEYLYTLDSNGNRTAVDGSRGTETYTLDALNRITAATYGDGTSESFVYDAAGYRTSHTDVDGVTTGHDIDAAGQITASTDGVSYSYDAAGNLLGTSDGDAYVWDDWGNLTSATVGGLTQTYGYDATGLRVSVDGFGQVWDRATALPTLVSTGDGQNFVHSHIGVLREGDEWLLSDGLGSVRSTADDSASITSTRSYTAFGEDRGGLASAAFGFAGEQRDATGLYHLRARQYDPAAGRFLSTDPLQPGGPGTTGWNLYDYAGNNPTSWSDPSGAFDSTGYALLAANTATRTIPVIAIIVAAIVAVLLVIIALLVFDPFGDDGGPDGDEDGDGNPDPDQPGPDTPQPERPPNPFQDVADRYGLDPEQVRDCAANGRGSAACAGIPDEALDEIFRTDRGDGRDPCGRFAGGCDFGADGEQQGLDNYEAETGRDVERDQVRTTLPDGSQRYYDGLAQKPDGTYEGIEVKSGSATRDAGQRAFDGQVNGGTPGTATVNGQQVQVTSVVVIRVP